MITGVTRSGTLVAAVAISSLVIVLAFGNYRSASPVAESNLRGLALSLASAAEALAGADPSFATLTSLQSPDLAYLAVIASDGSIRHHTNPDLAGSRVGDDRYRIIFSSGTTSGQRVMLGTGEIVYEFTAPLHLKGGLLAVRLALHTYTADTIIRRARISLTATLSLLALAWVMGGLLWRSARRERLHHEQMARREQLATLGEMGAVIAHEVRNPLSGIKGYAQLLQERIPEGDAHAFAGVIVEESIRLEGLVQNLLTLSRVDRIDGSASIAQVCSRCVGLLEAEADRQGVILHRAVTDGLCAACPPERLEQLVLNLLTNALQAMPQGGRLDLAASRNGAVAEIIISDTGSGIPEGLLERVFDPFYTTKARGSGLGLAICRRIAEGCGGGITVSSRPGTGTEVRVTLPVSEETQAL